VTSNCAAVAPHRRFELRHRYTPHQAHRATSVLSAVAVQVLCANRWLRSGGDSCLASILRSNVDPWRWLVASFVRRTGSSMAIVSNFVDSAALLLREAPMAFFSAISASRWPLFIMRQSQPHGRLAMGRRACLRWDGLVPVARQEESMQQASEARRSQRRKPWALRAKSRKVVPWVCLMVSRGLLAIWPAQRRRRLCWPKVCSGTGRWFLAASTTVVDPARERSEPDGPTWQLA